MVPNDRLDCLPAFEQLALFTAQPLTLAPVLDLDARVVLVRATLAQVGMDHLGLDAQAFHQDAV